MVDFIEVPASPQATEQYAANFRSPDIASDARISGLSAADRWQIVAVALRSIGCANPRPAPISRAVHR